MRLLRSSAFSHAAEIVVLDAVSSGVVRGVGGDRLQRALLRDKGLEVRGNRFKRVSDALQRSVRHLGSLSMVDAGQRRFVRRVPTGGGIPVGRIFLIGSVALSTMDGGF